MVSSDLTLVPFGSGHAVAKAWNIDRENTAIRAGERRSWSGEKCSEPRESPVTILGVPVYSVWLTGGPS